MIYKYPNLIVYIDKDFTRYLPEKLDRNVKYTISFYVSLDSIDHHTGEKIETTVKEMSNLISDFTILPVPRCLFKTNYPKSISKRMINEARNFLMDAIDFRFFYDEEIESMRDRLRLFDLCLKCKFRKRKLCKGIYRIEAESIRKRKTEQWLFDEIQRQGCINFLDLGCGNTLFLPVYTKLARQDKSVFFCVDPSDISINNLNRKLPEDLRSNILPIIGTGEDLPLKNGFFDFVLLHYSYSHFMSIEKTMKNIYKILKKGGILLIFEAYHLKEKVTSEVTIKRESWKDIVLDRTEFRNHSLQDAIKILKTHGFEILDSFESNNTKQVSWGIKSKKV